MMQKSNIVHFDWRGGLVDLTSISTRPTVNLQVRGALQFLTKEPRGLRTQRKYEVKNLNCM